MGTRSRRGEVGSEASIYRSERGREAVRDWCTGQLAAWDLPHATREVDVRGAATHVTVAGAGAATVVFVPGTNFNTATSLPLLDELARDFAVVALDVPGQPGLSSGTRDPAGGIRWYGEWLDAAVEQVVPTLPGPSGRPVVLLGHSFGGAVVLASRRQGVFRLVASTGGLCRLRLTPAVLLAFVRWTVRPSRASSRGILTPMLAKGGVPRPELVEWMTLVGRHTRTSTSPDHVEQPSWRGAVLAVSGAQDVFLPPARLGPAVRRALGVELSIVDQAGHLIVEEAAGRLRELVQVLVGG